MPLVPTMSPRVGKSGPLMRSEQRVEQLLVGRPGVVEVPLDAGGNLTQVVRRDVRRHTDSDATRTVDQQVGETRWEHLRFLLPAVVVGPEVDGVAIDVAHHLHRQRRQPAFGISHSGLAVVTWGTEVALALHERIAQRPRLTESHQRVVDRGVAMGVVLTHHVTDDAGALREPTIRPISTVVHRVEHAAVHGLEPVTHVGQRALHDDAHRIVEVRALHLDLQVDRLDPTAGRWGLRRLGHRCSLLAVRVRRRARARSGWSRCRGTGRPLRCAG